ncbi:MAG: hypothetical protein IT423_14765 [Pirellulaceae bacterium]|nr:hypothetical protein [Pirellulaceae bacterium]
MVSLLRKEFLENVRWLPLGMLVCLTLLITSMAGGWLSQSSPLHSNMLIGISLIAIAMALLQSIPDSRNGARAYLLHRSVSARQAYWAKTIVGAGLVAISVMLPLAGCALWLAQRGVLSAPGRPIQMLPPAVLAIYAWLFYPAIMIIIYRPAKWLGSRCIPFVLVLVINAAALSALENNIDVVRLYQALGYACILGLLLSLAGQYAFAEAARLPAPSSPVRSTASAQLLNLVLIASLVSSFAVVGGFLSNWKEFLAGPKLEFCHLVFRQDSGEPWIAISRQEWQDDKHQVELVHISGDRVQPGKMPDTTGPLPEGFRASQQTVHLGGETWGYGSSIAYHRFPSNSQRWSPLTDKRGYALFYERYPTVYPKLSMVISRDGVRDPRGNWGQPFDQLFGLYDLNGELTLMGDRHGIYQALPQQGQLRTLLNESISSATTHFETETARLFVRQSKQLKVYELVDEQGSRNWHTRSTNENLGQIALTANLVDTFELPESIAGVSNFRFIYLGKGEMHLQTLGTYPHYWLAPLAEYTSDKTDPRIYRPVMPPEMYAGRPETVSTMATLLPPGPLLLEPLVNFLRFRKSTEATLAEIARVRPTVLPWIVVISLLQSLLAGGLTYLAAKRRDLFGRRLWAWIVLGMILGWAIPLAVLAIYPKMVRVACPSCQALRRIDSTQCEHCQTVWVRPARQGIEIIESEFDTMDQLQTVRN